jgi:hypothetical protein
MDQLGFWASMLLTAVGAGVIWAGNVRSARITIVAFALMNLGALGLVLSVTD